jgi:hypothetical protein
MVPVTAVCTVATFSVHDDDPATVIARTKTAPRRAQIMGCAQAKLVPNERRRSAQKYRLPHARARERAHDL